MILSSSQKEKIELILVKGLGNWKKNVEFKIRGIENQYIDHLTIDNYIDKDDETEHSKFGVAFLDVGVEKEDGFYPVIIYKEKNVECYYGCSYKQLEQDEISRYDAWYNFLLEKVYDEIRMNDSRKIIENLKSQDTIESAEEILNWLNEELQRDKKAMENEYDKVSILYTKFYNSIKEKNKKMIHDEIKELAIIECKKELYGDN